MPDLSASFNASQHQPASFQLLDGKPAEQRQPWEARSRFEVEKEVTELKKLQQKLGDSLEWILETFSQEDDGEFTILRKRQALESLTYAKDVLKGSVSAVDDTRLFDEKALRARENTQATTLATTQVSHISGYPPLLGSPTSTWFDAQNTVTSQTNNPRRPRGLGHSSSSPSLSGPSVRLPPVLPRTSWTPVSDKPASTDQSAESTSPKPQQRSASSPSRPIQTETSAAKSPIQHDPLGVL